MFLNCHTWFSFKYGTLSPEKLFFEAKRLGIKKLVITEINNTCSYVEMLRICQEHREEYQLDIAVGIEIRKDNEFLYILIAQDNQGFEEINRFVSHCNNEKKEYPVRAPEFEKVYCIYSWGKIYPEILRNHEFIGVRVTHFTHFMLDPHYNEHKDRYVIWHPVTFTGEIGLSLHRVLRAMDNNVVLTKLSPLHQADKTEFPVAEWMLEKKFYLFPGLVANTRSLLANCKIEFVLGTDKNKKYFTGSEANDWDMLVSKSWEGFQSRYDVSLPVLRERYERELNIIRKKNFCSYYLIACDLIQFVKESGYDHVGRGSGANSLIAYCLGITDVDPIELDLYFERFLNEERTSPPDFDIDFSWDERNHIYDYLIEKHGKDHVCLLGAFVTFQQNSIIRELGKVFGLPKSEIDEISENPSALAHRDKITELIFSYAVHLKEMPAHLSIHAGGVLITEKPVYHYAATDLPPKNYPVLQLDMYSAEDMGIYKLDILSQRGLGHIKDTAKLVKKTRGIDIDVHRFQDFKKDEKIRDLLKNSKAMGCFYIESPAMRTLIAKLKCEDYLTLVAASSIIRPGVASSGMMKAYIERYHLVRNGKKYESIHPKMDELMAETYGVMVYQEDVIKVAHKFGGLTLTEADVLRRAMSGKFRGRKAFDLIREKFFQNCKAYGYEDRVTNRVWFEIESFGGYSFAKGHSASFAVESYQSAYLKAHFPLEFMVSVINNFGGFYKTEFYFHEARMLGGSIQAPCINNSEYLTTLLEGSKIYMGFVHVKGIEQKLGQTISEERTRGGGYLGIHDFLHRLSITLEQITLLIQVGAFRFTGKTKQTLKWEAMLYFSNAKQKAPAGKALFELEEENFDLPLLETHELDDAFDEIELLGFPLCDPFHLVKGGDLGDSVSTELNNKLGKTITISGYVVDVKYTSTKQGHLMYFGAFYDRHGIFFDTVHFPDVAKQFPFRGRGFYLVKGKVVEDFGVPIIEVKSMEKMGVVQRGW
jgi:DNA polymerase-3 subunit alpha